MIYEVVHWSALAPLAGLALFKRDVPLAFWLCALAFACSAVADSVAALTGGSWIADGWYQMAQLTFFGAAILAPDGKHVLAPVMLYVVLGYALYFGMIQHRSDPASYTEFMRWWYPYQATRLASFGLFGWRAWRA